MTERDVATRRLRAQGAGGGFASPLAVVERLLAVQAQDLPGALWAVGLRARGATEADVDRALATGEVVRSWVLRGTLHLVPGRDLRWLLALVRARVLASRARRWLELGLDGRTFARAEVIVARALAGGRRLGRDALYRALDEGGVATGGQRGIHLLQRLALDGLVCFAAREGRRPTLALLDEWLPPARTPGREEALAELATRYVAGHGPATRDDLVWWSGLPAADADAALALAAPRLAREELAGRVHWSPREGPAARRRPLPPALLLPPFDELLVGYRDRSALLDPRDAARVHDMLSPTIVVGRRVVGTWTRTVARGAVTVRAALFPGAPAGALRALAAPAEAYGRFLDRAAALRRARAATWD